MSRIPVLIASGISPVDANSPKLPLTRYDQAIAAFADDSLLIAWWAGRLAAGTPIDRITAQSLTPGSALPTATAEDSIFGGRPSLTFGAANAALTVPNSYSQNWTQAFVVSPNTLTIGAPLFVYGQSGGYGGICEISAGNFSVNAIYGSGSKTLSGANLIAGSANIIVVCGDSATKTIAVYANSKTPLITTAFASWPASLSNPRSIVCGAGSTASAAVRVAQHAIFSKSLHHDDTQRTRLMDLIDAASETYGITLA